MKKIIPILLVLSLAIGVSGCQSSTQETNGEDVLEDLESISIGEQVEVNTDYGDFLLTIDNVKETDWLSYVIELGLVDSNDFADDSKTVIVECNVDNIGYEDPSNENFQLKNYLSVADNEGHDAEYFGYGLDDGNYTLLATVGIGEEGNIVVPFICESNAQNLTININNQYILETQIEDVSDVATEDTQESSQSDSSEYGIDQLVGYNSLIDLPDGSPVIVQGIAYEMTSGIYLMQITTEDPGNLNVDNIEYKNIYILDSMQEQSYDKKYISVSGHTYLGDDTEEDQENSIPSVIAEIIEDESEEYINSGGTLPE